MIPAGGRGSPLATHMHEKSPAVLAGPFRERLFSLCGKTAPAAFALTDHLRAFLAGSDTVAVAFEDFLGNPADDGRGVLGAVELLCELDFELFDV